MKIIVTSLNSEVVDATFKPNFFEWVFGAKEGKRKLAKVRDKKLPLDSILDKDYFFMDEDAKEYYLKPEILLYEKKEKYNDTIRRQELIEKINKAKEEQAKRELEDKGKCVCQLIAEGKVDSGWCHEHHTDWA